MSFKTLRFAAGSGISYCRRVSLRPPKQISGARWESNAATDQVRNNESSNLMDNRTMYRYLRIENFSDSELDEVFERIRMASDRKRKSSKPPIIPTLEEDLAGVREENSEGDEPLSQSGLINQENIRDFLLKRVQEMEEEHAVEVILNPPHLERQRDEFCAKQAQELLKLLSADSSSTITKESFRQTIQDIGSKVDYRRMMPITISTLMVGTSVGIVSPVMPFVVEALGLTAGQFGMIVSAFALAKISSNVPSAVLVERHGRKPYMVHSLSLIAAGTAGIGLANSFEELFFSRLLVGVGVAALSSASTMIIADMSTSKNRAQTMAPMMSSFAAGTSMGPAIGGILADKIGVHPTFYVVGACFLTMTVVNQMLLSETQHKPIVFPWQSQINNLSQKNKESIWNATKHAFGQWKPLMTKPKIRNVVIINGFYWVAIAGAQLTLLPLMLTDPNGLAMTATDVGKVYMGMSLVQVLGNPIVARSVDKLGKVPAMIVGCTIISGSMASLPFAHDIPNLAMILGTWAAGSTLLSIAPVAYISDVTEDENRAHAIALLRTAGDVGFLAGASAVGALADWTGNLDIAMQSSAGVLLTATTWFGIRQYLLRQELLQKMKKS